MEPTPLPWPPVDLARVQEELEILHARDPADATSTDEEGEPLWDPVVVFASISRVAFDAWLKANEGVLRRWCYEPLDERSGRVVIYSLPTEVHEAAAGEVLKLVLRPLRANYRDVIDTFEVKPSPTCKLRDRAQEADMTLTPMETCLEVAFPNLVVEVEYENLACCKLKEKLLRWIAPETTVQVAIGIKIYKQSRNHVALLLVRGETPGRGEPLLVPFGKNAVVPPELSFPSKLLYHGAQIPSQLLRHQDQEITIDLTALRAHIDARINRDEERKRSREVDELEEPTKKKKRNFNMKDIDKELEAIQLADVGNATMGADTECEPLWHPVVVCDSISRPAFREWLSANSGKRRRWWFEPIEGEAMGRVIAHSRPHAVLKATTREIVDSLQEQLIKQGGPRIQRTFDGEYDPVYALSDRDQQADWSFTPRESSATSAFPNLVIDVEFRNVSLRKLREKISRWMGPETTIQVAIGIKINETTQTHVAILHVRDQQPRVVRFDGTLPSNAERLSFPIAALYHGATIPPLRDNDARGVITISIDLCELHRVIENERRTVVKVEPKAE